MNIFSEWIALALGGVGTISFKALWSVMDLPDWSSRTRHITIKSNQINEVKVKVNLFSRSTAQASPLTPPSSH